MSAGSETSTWTADDDDKLVRPKAELCSLLQHVGATKEVFTMKEVMFYLGQYILQKQLYDQRQQHFVHCGQDALGQVLGVDSFSMKEPQVLFAMITKNLVAVRNQEVPRWRMACFLSSTFIKALYWIGKLRPGPPAQQEDPNGSGSQIQTR